MRLSPLTIGLGLSMTVGYGTLYYSFALLAPEIARSLGWDLKMIFGIFSLSLLGGALAAPPVGRLIDRLGARPVMSWGTVIGSLTLAGYSLITEQWHFAFFILLTECVAVAVQYEAGFAALAKVHGMAARNHITGVTLIAGLSSTIFWPLTQHLLGMMDWRQVYLVLAAINLVFCLPVHLSIPRHSAAGKETAEPLAGNGGKAVALITAPDRRIVMILMGTLFTGTGFLMSAINSSIIVLLSDMKIEAHAATWAIALIGPAQVLARLLDLWFSNRLPATGIAIISTAGIAVALLVLLLASQAPLVGLVGIFALIYGTGQGLNSIVRGVLPLNFFGHEDYGRITGSLSGYRLAFSAIAPLAVISLNDLGGPVLALSFLVMIGALSVLAVLMLARQDPSRIKPNA